MRTLTTSITNALAAKTRTPAVAVHLFDPIQHYASYQTTTDAEGWPACCIASDGSIIRAYLNQPGGAFAASLFVQRITDPSVASQWSTWTVISSANLVRDAGCALSNNGGTLRVFAQSGTSPFPLWTWESTNDGASWTSPNVIANISASIRGIGSGGNNDVFYAFDSGGGEKVAAAFFSSGSWSAPSTWTLGIIAACVGIDAAWDATNSRYLIPVSDGRSIQGYTYTPVSATWALDSTIAPFDSASAVGLGRLYPRLQFFDSLWCLCYLEVDSGAFTGLVYSYARLRQSIDYVHFSDGTILQQTFAFGPTWIKAPTPPSGSAGPGYYVTENKYAWRADTYDPTNPAQFLDVSAQVLEVLRKEAKNGSGKLTLHLSNAGGQYNGLTMLGKNTSVALFEGYHDPTTGTPSTIATGIYYVDTWQYVRNPETNQLVIEASDATKKLGLMEGQRGPQSTTGIEENVTQTVHTYVTKPPAVITHISFKNVTTRYQKLYSGDSINYLLIELPAIAGIFSVSLPGTTQMSEGVGTFIIGNGQKLSTALAKICAIYSLYFFLDQTETLQVRELSSGDASVATIQPEIESVTFGTNDEQANHIICQGRDSSGLTVYGEAYDWTHMAQVGRERPLFHIDTQLTTAAQAALKANFLLADEQRSAGSHVVVIASHPGLQVLDVVTLIDSSTGQNLNARIAGLEMLYQPGKGEYSLSLSLEAP